MNKSACPICGHPAQAEVESMFRAGKSPQAIKEIINEGLAIAYPDADPVTAVALKHHRGHYLDKQLGVAEPQQIGTDVLDDLRKAIGYGLENLSKPEYQAQITPRVLVDLLGAYTRLVDTVGEDDDLVSVLRQKIMDPHTALAGPYDPKSAPSAEE